MSQANLQIVYFIWAPQSTAGDVESKRTANFDAHVAWLQARGAEGTLRESHLPSLHPCMLTRAIAPEYGGAILSEDQKLPLASTPEIAGLMLIVKANDLAAARKFLEEEPYYKAGVVRIVPPCMREAPKLMPLLVGHRQHQGCARPL